MHQLPYKVTVRIPDNDIKKIDIIRGIESRSQIIRQAINEYVKKNIDKLEAEILVSKSSKIGDNR